MPRHGPQMPAVAAPPEVCLTRRVMRDPADSDDQPIEAIVEDLAANDKDVRRAAIERLAAMEPDTLASAAGQLVEPLVRAIVRDTLSDPGFVVLATIGEPGVPALVQLAKGSQPLWANAADRALMKLGDPSRHPSARTRRASRRARARLTSATKADDYYQAERAIHALWEIGDEDALKVLQRIAETGRRQRDLNSQPAQLGRTAEQLITLLRRR